MSIKPSNHSSLIEIVKLAQDAVNEEFQKANKAAEYYQHQKQLLWTMRVEAEEHIRDLKLQFDNTVHQLRQHIAKIQRDHRLESQQLRKLWADHVLK